MLKGICKSIRLVYFLYFIPDKLIVNQGLDQFTATAAKLAGVSRKCFCLIFHTPTIIDRTMEEVNTSKLGHFVYIRELDVNKLSIIF